MRKKVIDEELKAKLLLEPEEKSLTPEEEQAKAEDVYEIVSEEDELPTVYSPKEIQRQNIALIEEHIKQKKVMYGKIVGTEKTVEGLVIILRVKGIRTIILARDFFAFSDFTGIISRMDEIKKMPEFVGLSEDDIMQRMYQRRAVKMLNATVACMPKKMGLTNNGNPFLVASRAIAFSALRNRYFFSPFANVKEGTQVKCRVIRVIATGVQVEALGCEVFLNLADLTAAGYIDDANDEYKVGDCFIALCTKLEVDKEKQYVNMKLSISALEIQSHLVEQVSESMVNGRYLGRVKAVKPDFYVVSLVTPKIDGIVRKSDYLGIDELERGDAIVIEIKKIVPEKNQFQGYCLKKSS